MAASDGALGCPTTMNSIVYFNNDSGTASNYQFATVGMTGAAVNCCLAPAVSGGNYTNFSTNNITFNPQFADWQTGDYHLTKDSPCVNAGFNQAWMATATDLDGRPRLDKFSGIVDIGCYEYLFSGMLVKIQ
jgi:hypothetical protein